MGQRVNAVSDDGLSVAATYWTASNDAAAASWTSSTGFIPIPCFVGTDTSFGFGVSADGLTVVGFCTAGNTFSERAFRWTEQNGLEQIPIGNGFNYNQARDVSADGSAVCGITGNAQVFRSFLWTESTGSIDLGSLQNSAFESSSARGISGDGTTVVGQGFLATTPRAFRWTQQSGMIELSPLQGMNNSTAQDVSFDGTIAVGSSSNPGGDAVVWDADGQPTNLGTFTSEALAVNADGSVIVGRGFAGGEVGFLWTPELGSVDLNTYLPTLGIDLSGWQLERATGVSADGTKIVGWGRNNGELEGWLLDLNPAILLGDVNLDGSINLLDVQPFVDLLSSGLFQAEADMNQDGAVNLLDVQLFIDSLAG